MELLAAIQTLNHIPAGQDIRITTDSEYVIKGMTEWLDGWIENDWKTRKGRAVKNIPQWEALLESTRRHRSVSWAWVKGHKGHPQNELADQLAVAAIHRLTEMNGDNESAATRIHHVSTAPQSRGLADVPMRQVAPDRNMRVIRTDNYDTPHPVEYFVAQRLTLSQAQAVARALNEAQDADGPDYFRVVDGNYQLTTPLS